MTPEQVLTAFGEYWVEHHGDGGLRVARSAPVCVTSWAIWT